MANMTFGPGRLPPVLGSYGGMKPKLPAPTGRPADDFGTSELYMKPAQPVQTSTMVNDLAPVATRPAPQPVGGLTATRPMNPYGRRNRHGRF